jgi:hypothetical protein
MSWEILNDIQSYLSLCNHASKDERVFSRFKQEPAYRQILEHVSYETGLEYIEKLKCPIENVLLKIDEFKENDFYGQPDLFEYGELGKLSPTTIRYIKNSYDILNYFKDIEIKNIVEIGGGYGGLCKVISSVIDYDNYVMFDLLEVNRLIEKYISKFPKIRDKVQAFTLDQLEEIDNIDLLISNYAFSELSKDLQIEYYEKVICKTDNFYITFNPISKNNLQFDEFLELFSSKFNIDYYCEFESESMETCNKVVYGKKICI